LFKPYKELVGHNLKSKNLESQL